MYNIQKKLNIVVHKIKSLHHISQVFELKSFQIEGLK